MTEDVIQPLIDPEVMKQRQQRQLERFKKLLAEQRARELCEELLRRKKVNRKPRPSNKKIRREDRTEIDLLCLMLCQNLKRKESEPKMKLPSLIFYVAPAVAGYTILNDVSLALWLKIVLVLSAAFVFAGVSSLLTYLDEHDFFILKGARESKA